MDVRVQLGGDDVDDAERAELARDLQAMLRDLHEVDEATLLAHGPAPAGTKSGGLVTWGALVVSLASAGSLPGGRRYGRLLASPPAGRHRD